MTARISVRIEVDRDFAGTGAVVDLAGLREVDGSGSFPAVIRPKVQIAAPGIRYRASRQEVDVVVGA